MAPTMNLTPEDVLATYQDRKVSLEVDGAESELSVRNQDDMHYNREKITQTDIRDFSVTGNLFRVQYGRWYGSPACLVCMRFQILGTASKLWRFRGANFLIEFTARPVAEPNKDPSILNYGPKSLRSESTSERRDWHLVAQFSAQANVGPVSIGPTFEGAKGGEYVRQYASTMESSDWGNSKHDKPNCLKVHYREDAKQKSSSSRELLIACVISCSGPCQCTVQVKADVSFPMNLVLGALIWGKDDPVLLEPPIELLEIGQGKSVPDDFETMTDDHWRQLVTSTLSYREVIQNAAPAI